MAHWNEKYEGDELEECPICMMRITKKKRTLHVSTCYDKNIHAMDELGLMKCPLHPLHIIEKKYLNHHLYGNCEEAQNRLRDYFQRVDLFRAKGIELPDDFLSFVPDDILDRTNKKLLFFLKRDFDGEKIID